jgi:serine/threonine protein kinase
LALMDHPNIAKVLDAGTMENGRPYFVMELVRGIKITDYCDQNHLDTTQRLGHDRLSLTRNSPGNFLSHMRQKVVRGILCNVRVYMMEPA